MSASEAQPRHSCLYTGTVMHRRTRPVENAFRYRLFMLYLDLDELPELFDRRWFWSARGPNLAWFRRADHLGDPARPLAEEVRDRVDRELGFRPDGPIRLLTNLRYWGYEMSPVNFYYCYAAAGAPVAFIAEVNNTPWGEQHCYVFPWEGGDADADGAAAEPQRWRNAKTFHVSPFLPMAMEYRWRVTEPDADLWVEIENHDAAGAPFWAALQLERRPLTGGQLAGTLLRFPFMSGKIVAAIYWQAAKLWFKGAVYYPHP